MNCWPLRKEFANTARVRHFDVLAAFIAFIVPVSGCISNWGQIGRLQVAATITKSTFVDYAPKLKCTSRQLSVSATAFEHAAQTDRSDQRGETNGQQ